MKRCQIESTSDSNRMLHKWMMCDYGEFLNRTRNSDICLRSYMFLINNGVRLVTLRRGFHSHICTPLCHRSWSELSNLIELHTSWSTCHISTSSHRASCRSASWYRLGPPGPLTGHGARMWVPGTRTPSSWSLCLFSASASMANCALFCEAEDSDPFETPCYRSHKWTYLWPEESLETRR